MTLPRLDAPFSTAEVEALNQFQRTGSFHPFTCPHRERATHRWAGHDFGLLEAREEGWVCPDCGYVQTWAFAFMAGPTSLARYGPRPA